MGRKPLSSRIQTIIALFTAASTLASRLQLIEHKELGAKHLSHEDSFINFDERPTRVFVIRTEEDARQMAELHATGWKELMFTTYSFTHNGMYSYDAVNQARHVWESLRGIDRLKNALIISYDTHSCQVLWEHGIPCFLDRYLPQPRDLPGQYGYGVPHWYQKYAWALKFMEWGYSVTFFETDMVFFRDPLPYRNPDIDLQGLSDWHQATLPMAKERFKYPCNVYHMHKGDNGDNYLEWGPNDPNNVRSQTAISPCMSTGFWFANPSPPIMEFFEGFIDLMLHWRNSQTDQRLWNEVMMAFLIGQDRRPPMTFSLLDVQFFANFEVFTWRKEQNLTVSPVMLHTGSMPGGQKEPYLKEHGYWRAEDWSNLGAADHIKFLLKHMNRTVPL